MHMCFKSWLYNSSMLRDEFDEEEDCEASEAWSNSHEDDVQYYFYCWCMYCVWCERQD